MTGELRINGKNRMHVVDIPADVQDEFIAVFGHPTNDDNLAHDEICWIVDRLNERGLL